MNTEKVQAEINTIITSIKAKGWKLTKTTKKALVEAEALGLTPYLGIYAREDVKGYQIVNAVIDAAKDAGSKVSGGGFSPDGDGETWSWTNPPSALYLALNETEPKAPETSAPEPTVEDAPSDLIPALMARAAGLANQYLTADEAWNEHIGWIASIAYTPKEAREAVKIETELREKGNKYFEMGYRLRRLPRQEVWFSYRIPDEAIDWYLESAGYRATSECHRLVYAIKRPALEDVMTTAEIAEEFGIADCTVRAAIKRNVIPARQSGSTWLVRREDAVARWG